MTKTYNFRMTKTYNDVEFITNPYKHSMFNTVFGTILALLTLVLLFLCMLSTSNVLSTFSILLLLMAYMLNKDTDKYLSKKARGKRQPLKITRLLHYLHVVDRYKLKPNNTTAVLAPNDIFMYGSILPSGEAEFPKTFTLMYFINGFPMANAFNKFLNNNDRATLRVSEGYCVIANEKEKVMFCYHHDVLGYELIYELPRFLGKKWLKRFMIDRISHNYIDTYKIGKK